jgi:hypothetical protein
MLSKTAAFWAPGLRSLQGTAAATANLRQSFATQTKRPQDLRVAIIGSGVGGPALALLLKQRLGCTPVVFEAAHAIKEVGQEGGFMTPLLLLALSQCTSNKVAWFLSNCNWLAHLRCIAAQLQGCATRMSAAAAAMLRVAS